MRQNKGELQHKIDNFLERKTSEHPDIEAYAQDVYRLDSNVR